MSTPYNCQFCEPDLRGDRIPEDQRHGDDPPTHFTEATIIQRARGWVWKCPACFYSWEPATP